MRKTIDVTIEAENRDKGKTFRITEMPAVDAEEWGARVLLALTRARVQIPEGVEGMGLAGVAHIGLQAISGLTIEDARPLMADMMACVEFYPAANSETASPLQRSHARPLRPTEDIEEVSTLGRLRMEVFTLHTGFSVPGSLLSLMQETFRAAIASWSIQTSPA